MYIPIIAKNKGENSTSTNVTCIVSIYLNLFSSIGKTTESSTINRTKEANNLIMYSSILVKLHWFELTS